ATDASGIKQVQVLVNGTAVTVTGTTTWSAAAPLNSGSNLITVTAYDDSYNQNQTSMNIQVTYKAPDTMAPTVALTAPANGASVSGTTTLSANASDNVGVTRVDFYVDNALAGSVAASPYNLSYDSTKLTNGSHSIYAKAFDAAGNSANSSTANVTVSNSTTNL